MENISSRLQIPLFARRQRSPPIIATCFPKGVIKICCVCRNTNSRTMNIITKLTTLTHNVYSEVLLNIVIHYWLFAVCVCVYIHIILYVCLSVRLCVLSICGPSLTYSAVTLVLKSKRAVSKKKINMNTHSHTPLHNPVPHSRVPVLLLLLL